MITPQEALQRTIEHREIFHDEMLDLMRQIMSGQMSPVMIAAIIIGLRVKKETIGEITAAALVMRDLATQVKVKDPENLVDIVGTGGDVANPDLSEPPAPTVYVPLAQRPSRTLMASCSSAFTQNRRNPLLEVRG